MEERTGETMPKKSTSHKATGSSSMNARSRKSSPGGSTTSGSGHRRKSQRSWTAGGGNLTKGGCLPKLFILILPFLAVGAFLFTRL